MSIVVGPNLCVGTTNGNTLPDITEGVNPPEAREITFDTGAVLETGKAYLIQMIPTANYIQSMFDFPMENDYANGTMYFTPDSGGEWLDRDDFDMYFIAKAGGVEKDKYTFGDTLYTYGSEPTKWYVQTFTATSDYTITSVVLKLGYFDVYGLPGTITVSIREITTSPEKAINPTPTNAASDTTLDQATVTWENGGGATSYNVYYGTQSGNLSLVSSGQSETSFTISGITNGSPFGYEITRYWRIDSVNAAGTTTGDEWSFTTLVFDPPTVSVNSDGDATGVNNMIPVRRVVAAANNKMWIEI